MPKAPLNRAMPCWNGTFAGTVLSTKLNVSGPKVTSVATDVHHAGIQTGRFECDITSASCGGELSNRKWLTTARPTTTRPPNQASVRTPIGGTAEWKHTNNGATTTNGTPRCPSNDS